MKSTNPNHSEVLAHYCREAGACPRKVDGSEHDPWRVRAQRRRNAMLVNLHMRRIADGYEGDMPAPLKEAMTLLLGVVHELGD